MKPPDETTEYFLPDGRRISLKSEGVHPSAMSKLVGFKYIRKALHDEQMR